jgi:hypothetical protein
MAREQNMFYQDPAASIGQSLGRALFGDPAMAQKREQMRAEAAAREAAAEQARAHARYYDAQATGQGQQNSASAGLPAFIASLQAGPRPAPPETLDGFLSPEYAPVPEAQRQDAAFKGGIGKVIAAMAQMNGDKVDPSEIVGSLASMFGGDELARRGLVAQGHSPTADFAITPERADAIAANDASAKLRQALGVAQINNRDDIPVAEIQARSAGNVAQINNRDDIPVAEIAAGSRRDVATIKGQGTPVADGRLVAQSVYPGARITDNVRDPNSALGKANPDSWHNHSKAAVDVAPIPGMTFEQYIQGYRDKGLTILEAKNEVGAGRSAHATGDHWHVVLGQPTGGKKPAAPVQISGADIKLINQEIAAQFGRATLDDIDLNPTTKANIRGRAAAILQQTGNPALAVQRALQEYKDRHTKKAGTPVAPQLSRPAGVPVDARMRGDGKWFWKRGQEWFTIDEEPA